MSWFIKIIIIYRAILLSHRQAHPCQGSQGLEEEIHRPWIRLRGKVGKQVIFFLIGSLALIV